MSYAYLNLVQDKPRSMLISPGATFRWEKQRVSIAHALVKDPAIILADEPTANLDSKIGLDSMRLLQRIAKEQNRRVVIVSHDARMQDSADRVLWLEDGALKEMATMATDPVCSMKVERERAITTEWEG